MNGKRGVAAYVLLIRRHRARATKYLIVLLGFDADFLCHANFIVEQGGIMDQNMKKFIPLFVLLGLAVVVIAIYIIVYHVGMPTRDLAGAPANFWLGLWQGLIVFLSFIASWFDHNIVLYQVNNNGFWYNLGYVIGLLVLGAGGRGGARASKTKEKPKMQGPEAAPPPLLLFAGIAVAFAWLLFVGVWLFFFASGFGIGENAGIVILSLAVVGILETAIWLPWGMKQPGWGKSER
jgi:hypothetical protein